MRKITLCIALVLVISSSLSIYAQLELPAPTGPYAVGQMILRWVDASRPEVLTEDPNDVREVVAVIWYPAEPESGVKEGYFPHLASLSSAMIQSEEVKPWEVFGLRFIRSETRFEASPVKNVHPFPVVILSPGNGTNVEFYSVLAGELASHGYVVVAFDDENVLACALTDIAIDIQRQPFVEAVIMRFHADKLAVDVLPADLRQRCRCAGGHAPP